MNDLNEVISLKEELKEEASKIEKSLVQDLKDVGQKTGNNLKKVLLVGLGGVAGLALLSMVIGRSTGKGRSGFKRRIGTAVLVLILELAKKRILNMIDEPETAVKNDHTSEPDK